MVWQPINFLWSYGFLSLVGCFKSIKPTNHFSTLYFVYHLNFAQQNTLCSIKYFCLHWQPIIFDLIICFFYLQYKSPTSTMQHTYHACHMCVNFRACMYTCAQMCGLIVFMCDLQVLCQHTVIHTHVYNYKMVVYADRWV